MPPSDNDDLLPQLAGMGAAAGPSSNEDLLAAMNAPPEPDPLADVEYTGDLPEDSRRELTALQQGFRDRAKREAERFRQATDSEYWFAVCFRSREDKERFLRALHLLAVGDKYLDGYAVARLLRVDMSEDE